MPLIVLVADDVFLTHLVSKSLEFQAGLRAGCRWSFTCPAQAPLPSNASMASSISSAINRMAPTTPPLVMTLPMLLGMIGKPPLPPSSPKGIGELQLNGSPERTQTQVLWHGSAITSVLLMGSKIITAMGERVYSDRPVNHQASSDDDGEVEPDRPTKIYKQ